MEFALTCVLTVVAILAGTFALLWCGDYNDARDAYRRYLESQDVAPYKSWKEFRAGWSGKYL